MANPFTPVFFVNGRVLVWVRVGERRSSGGWRNTPIYKKHPPIAGRVLSFPSPAEYIKTMGYDAFQLTPQE
jgi:hypothetical protein